MTKFSLPERKITDDVYGAYELALKYSELENKNIGLKYGWQHGWLPATCLVNPYVVAGFKFSFANYMNKNFRLLVPFEEHKDYLKHFGLQSRAIGLPFVYFSKLNKFTRNFQRIPNSIIIIPAHGFKDEDDAGFYNFEIVSSIKAKYGKDFLISILAHEYDYSIGKYKKYEDQGFTIVRGAIVSDSNTYLRMEAIFSTFEYAAFGCFTTGILYANFYGCKTFFDPENYFVPKAEALNKTELFKNFPGSAELYSKYFSYKNIKKLYPNLGESITDASVDVDFAKHQFGFDNCLSPEEFRELIIESNNRGKMPYLKSTINSIFRKMKISQPFDAA